MLEIVNAAANIRQGEARISGDTAYQGHCAFIAGVNSDGEIIMRMPNSSAQAAAAYYPIKKIRFEEDLSDTSAAVDLLKTGDRVVYYEGGEFWTDRVARDIDFGTTLLEPTAIGRWVDPTAHTVQPNQALYVDYAVLTAGRLQVSPVATTQVGPNFRMIEAYGASAASVEHGTAQKLRFKVVPGFVGEVTI